MNENSIDEGQLLDRIFETSPTAIVVLTPDGRITRCNQRAEQLLKLDESTIEGKTYGEPEWTFTDSDGEPLSESEHPFVEVQETRAPIFNREYRMERPHASTIDVSISGAPLMDADGVVKRLIFSFEDVTNRREREREITQKNEQLEVLNRVVRHDIRNDMSVIMGWLETVEDEIESQEGREAFERVMTASQHVIELTKTTRDLVEVVTGDGTLTPEPIPLAPSLRNAIGVARESYPEAEIRVEGTIPDVDVMGTDLLGSVFQNLLNNGVQHNDAEEPTVTVSATTRDGRVRIAFADNGPGVPADMRESIFGKGEKGPASKGSGIGLYLVATIVDQIGGSVDITDNEPRGAVFAVELETA
ncbi:ATP-binding protein [Halanaeroarchaeum sulfurireducens]|uniref:Histidine kinase n=3 Tax=Halanaeroarchaeum sulfurireducens TaxID=1604004 RepID=A0A0F7PCT5_9EURY|nr:PAS domain-containing sensor histidine kinase [Halanaeroarchaeum sulfurireducens]AKH98527.1 histidine kinase [Halanaeroarchaeum sulfurireducens]